MTDDDLLQEIAAGGPRQSAALRTLYMGKGKAFGRFFLSKGLTRYDADDVLQETFMKILKSAAGFQVEGKANAWMWQIARNALIDHYRQ
jgi:RNA polymerase sigma-70 factor (ECF subfamily)